MRIEVVGPVEITWHAAKAINGIDADAIALNARQVALKDEPPRIVVQQVVDSFLADAKLRLTKEGWRKYYHCLSPFGNQLGPRPAESLTPAEVEAYARESKWSASYRNGILGSIVSAWRWTARSGLIAKNPLVGVRKPPKASRGAKALVSEENHRRLCKHAKPLLRAFLELLWFTGARPGEIASLRFEDVDAKNGVAILTDHKTAHLGKHRLIFLSTDALQIVRRLSKDVGEDGLLFRGVTAKALGLRLWRLCKRLGIPTYMAYGYRHAFAPQALANGVPDAHVAALLGLLRLRCFIATTPICSQTPRYCTTHCDVFVKCPVKDRR